MEYKSEDIIDIKKISQLLESYTKATGLETALLDLDGNIIMQSGWQKICTNFHRKNPETAQNCLESDTILAGKIKTGNKYNIYKCLNGLINIAVPIIVNDTHLYNLFTGQLFFETPNESFFIAQAEKYKFDKKEYLEALRQVPILKESEVKNKLLFLSQMTEVIVELGLEKYKRTVANITLKESEEKFRALYNNSPLSYQSLNKDGNYIDVNSAWLKMLGYKREEVINHSFFDFLHPESAEKAKHECFPNFKSCGFVKDIEFKIRHKTGHYINIAFEGYNDYNPDGSFKQTYCMFTDITKYKQANQLILKNKDRLEYALNSIETGAWELDLETLESWRTLKHDQIFGYNKPLKEWTYDIMIEHVIPEDREMVNQKFHQALSTKTDWNFECRIKRNNDGKICWIWANGNQEFNEQNESIKMFGIVQDITERKQVDEKLKESNELFHIAFNQQFQFMTVLSPDGRVIEINELPLKMQGGTRKEILGQIFWELKTWQNNPDWQAKIKKQILEASTKQETLLTEDTFTTIDGEAHTALAAYTAIRDTKNNVRYILVQATDITERKQAEETIKNQATKWQTTFNAMSDSVSIIDLDGNISQYNTSTLAMFTANEEDLKEKKCFEMVHETKGFFNDCPLVRMKKSHKPESIIFDKNGRWLEINVDPIFNSKNELTGAVHVVSDITDRKEAEQAVYLSNERYKTLFNNSPIPLWEEDLTEVAAYISEIKIQEYSNLHDYFNNNPNELVKCANMINVLDVNQAALDLHEAKNKNHLIENLSEIFTEKSFIVLKNEILAMTEGKETFKSESEVKTLSGNLRNIHITLKIDKSQSNKVKALIATPDITKQKQAEEKLRDSEFLYKETQRLSKMGGWSHDVESGQSTYTDTIYEIYGKKFSTTEEGQHFYHPDDKELVSRSFNETITRQKPYDLEVRFINAQGDNLYVRTIGQPIIKNGKVIKVYGNLIDITERKKAEQELTKHREHLEVLVKERTIELETKNKELARFNDLFVDREFRIKELKNEIDKLVKYNSDKK
ncbi:PAS domain S-box protein [Ancylomarina sp. 16SWW S1-10-2]|uniref:PAS domain S-box protein n=1 Tax=Ancylomarina sp. 16SWW S1-10-2 TaxID=2499681 RepID=UPI0012AE5A08|nr:PAS domain S-box protein [Ancylomarina sp. 16SWW S1-10-2]MRT94301.1 PAS domain S-box protein [Ancylomarina sp. 16SWW S1-10-2]